MLKISLRLKLSLICFAGLLVVGAGALGLFSKAWVDLSRAYGLLSLNNRLESSQPENLRLEGDEWALAAPKAAQTPAVWLKGPEGSSAADLEALASGIAAQILGTRLSKGSLELSFERGQGPESYFVVFKESADKYVAIGTRAHRNLWDLSPWAAPFLGLLLFAFALSTALVVIACNHISHVYGKLATAARNIGAGRLQNLDLPEGESDPLLQGVSDALRDMVALLAAKEKKISEVSQLADEDPMTGLPNYRAFTNYLGGVATASKNSPGNVSVLGIVDLDFFKKVNDTHGHQVGDFVLRATAAEIKKVIRTAGEKRPPDFCGRYGGEEFIVIFSDCPPAQMHAAAHRLTQAIKAMQLTVPAEISESKQPFSMRVSASMGIAAWDATRHKSSAEWLQEADAALYEAKRRGRARLVRIHPQLQEWLG